MLEEKIRVRAKPHAKVPYRGADGALVAWRFVGRERVWPHDVVAAGEELTLTARNRSDVMRAIADGDLERVEGPDAALAQNTAALDRLGSAVRTKGAE